MSENNKTTPVQKLVIGAESAISSPEVKTTMSDMPDNLESMVDVTENNISNTSEEKIVVNNTSEEDVVTTNNIQDIPMNTNPVNPLITDPQTLSMLKSLSFWTKFVSVFQFIGAGFIAFAGLVYIIGIITIPLTLLYWILAGITVWTFVKAWQAANNFRSLTQVESQESFNSNTLKGLNNLKTFFKIQGIMIIVGLGFLVLAIIGGIFFGVWALNNPGFKKSLENPYSTSITSPNYNNGTDFGQSTDF